MKARKLATDTAPLPTTDQGSEESPPDILEIIRTKLLMASDRCDAEAIIDIIQSIPSEHALAIGRDEAVMNAIGDALTFDQALELVPLLGRMPPTFGGVTVLDDDDLDEILDDGDQNIETFQEDLGNAKNYSHMAKLVGRLIDAHTLGPGSFCKGKASLTFRFPPPTPNASPAKSGFELKLIFELGASRGEKKLKVKTGLGIQVTHTTKLAGLKAEAGAMLMATATAQGNDGPHCIDLIGLGILKQLEAFLGVFGRDKLLGEGFQERVVDSMEAVDAKKPKALAREHRISDERFQRRNRKLDAEAFEEKKAERDQARDAYAAGHEKYNKAMKEADYVEMGSSLTLHAKLGRERKKTETDPDGNVITKKKEDELKAEVGYERARKYYKGQNGELKKADVEQVIFTSGTAKFGDSKAKVKLKFGLGKKGAGKVKLDVEGEQGIEFGEQAHLVETLFRTTVGLAADIKQIASKGKRRPDESFYDNLDASFGAMASAQFQPFADMLLKGLEPSEAANQRRIAKGKNPKEFKYKGKSKVGLEYNMESYGPTFSHSLTLSASNTRSASVDGGAVKGEIEIGAGNKMKIFDFKGSAKSMSKKGEIATDDLDELILVPDSLLKEQGAVADVG